MNQEEELARRIAQVLDQGTERFTAQQRERLKVARQLALSRYSAGNAPAWAPAWAGNVSRFTEHPVFGIRYLVPIAALVLGLLGAVYLQNGATGEIADIDAGLLTDELPINAYLDKGFDSWLTRSSH